MLASELKFLLLASRFGLVLLDQGLFVLAKLASAAALLLLLLCCVLLIELLAVLTDLGLVLILELLLILGYLCFDIKLAGLLSHFATHGFKLALVLGVLLLLQLLDLSLDLLIDGTAFLLELPLALSPEGFQLCLVLSLNLAFLLLETLDLALVGVEAPALLLLELLDLELEPLLLGVLYRLADACVLVSQSLPLTLKLLVHFLLVLA